MKVNDTLEFEFIEQALEQHTRRFIAALLGDIETHLGGKNRDISTAVKDTANASKRIILRKLTGFEVEDGRG